MKALFLLVLTSFSFQISAQIFEGGDPAKGEKLFKSNCAACHKITNEALAAPGLGGIADRWGSTDEMLVQWVKNPKKAIDSGDDYVNKMYKSNKGKFGMMAGQLVDEAQIKDIMAYIQNPPAKADGGAAVKTNECETIHDNDTIFTGSSTITSMRLDGIGAENFSIDANGTVRVLGNLDYESVKYYIFKVIATNTKADSAPVNVSIDILNIPEIPPTLNPLTISVEENATLGTILGKISVKDVGDAPITSYRLDDNSTFSIDVNGTLRVNTALDYETQTQYTARMSFLQL